MNMKKVLLIGNQDVEGEFSDLLRKTEREHEEISVIRVTPDQLGKRRRHYASVLKSVTDANIDTIFCSADYVDVAAKLLWQTKCVQQYILSNTSDAREVEGSNPEIQRRLWDGIAQQAEEDATTTGWTSSFTGTFFSEKEMQEFANNVVEKLEGDLTCDSVVLEIGIASGITCQALAPRIKTYYGIDVSKLTLEKTEKRLISKGIDNVVLREMEAINIDTLGLCQLNGVIINSVAQYFPGYNYCIRVIEKCIPILSETGFLFLGDILDYELQHDFENQVKESGGVGGNKNDLWYPQSFFRELSAIFPEIESVDITKKSGEIQNEMTMYRYDVRIKINKENRNRQERGSKHQYTVNDFLQGRG